VLTRDRQTIQKPEIIIVSSKNEATVYLYGRIDVDSSPDIRGALLTLFEAPHPATVSIDLSAVTQIDSSGVATLIEALKTARAHGTELRLEG
jgi:anti-sigma B factor antagonist